MNQRLSPRNTLARAVGKRLQSEILSTFRVHKDFYHWAFFLKGLESGIHRFAVDHIDHYV